MYLQVHPELFTDVTVFFSEIVEFLDITKTRTHMEVIELLNKIYINFDERISCYDVYKIETIGHAYMVSSGINTVALRV